MTTSTYNARTSTQDQFEMYLRHCRKYAPYVGDTCVWYFCHFINWWVNKTRSVIPQDTSCFLHKQLPRHRSRSSLDGKTRLSPVRRMTAGGTIVSMMETLILAGQSQHDGVEVVWRTFGCKAAHLSQSSTWPLFAYAYANWPSYFLLPVAVASSHWGKLVLYIPPLKRNTESAWSVRILLNWLK